MFYVCISCLFAECPQLCHVQRDRWGTCLCRAANGHLAVARRPYCTCGYDSFYCSGHVFVEPWPCLWRGLSGSRTC